MSETAIIVAIIGALGTVVGGSLLGLAALRRSGREADKSGAEASAVIVGSAAEVITMLRDQMAEMRQRIDEAEERLIVLESAVRAWDVWADRVLSLIDRAVHLLPPEHQAALAADVEQAHATRPPKAGA